MLLIGVEPDMRKIFIISFLFFLFFCSCNSTTSNKHQDNNKTMRLTSEFNVSEYLKIEKDNFIKMNHVKSVDLDLKKYEKREIEILKNRKILSCTLINDSLLLEIYSDEENGGLEIGLIELKSNTYKKIGNTPFSAAYGKNSIVLQNRFYITSICYNENNNKLFGKILLYDCLTDNFTELDNYGVLNIVQYIAPVNDNGVAYCYYEADTQDWVVKYFDISENHLKEVFRYSNYTGSNISPMSLSSDKENITLVMQFTQENKYHTQIAYINIGTGLNYVEEIDFREYFGDEYEILDFMTDGSVYFLKIDIQGTIEWHIFKRDGDKMNIILPAICHLDELISTYPDSSSIPAFQQYNPSIGDLIDINIFDSTLKTYNIKKMESNKIEFIKSNGKDIIVILKNELSDKFEYVYINDYRKIDKPAWDQWLFVYPQDEDISAIPEKSEEMKKNIQSNIEDICKNDFRWKYLFLDN